MNLIFDDSSKEFCHRYRVLGLGRTRDPPVETGPIDVLGQYIDYFTGISLGDYVQRIEPGVVEKPCAFLLQPPYARQVRQFHELQYVIEGHAGL